MKKEDTRGKKKAGFFARLLSSIHYLVDEDTNTEDKRRAHRITCRAEVAYVDINGTRGNGFLVDISKNGLQLETESKLYKGMTVAIKAPEEEMLDNTAPFMAKVRWVRKKHGIFRVGLALPDGIHEDPNWLESLLKQLGYNESESQKRQHIRASSEIPGQLTLDGDQDRTSIGLEVLNLGMGGALLRSEQDLEKDSQFSLLIGPFEDLPPLVLTGTILRVVEKPDKKFNLFPSRFRPQEEKETKVLQEYILKLSGDR